MDSYTCENCCYYGVCSEDEVCGHFAPVDEDLYIENQIENERMKFRKEWYEYNSTFYN